MILQVIVSGKVIHTDTVDYYKIPEYMVSEMERTWRIHEMREGGIECGIALVVGSRMNCKSFQLEEF